MDESISTLLRAAFRAIREPEATQPRWRDIAQQTRHRSLEIVRRYIREGELFHKGNSARFTGSDAYDSAAALIGLFALHKRVAHLQELGCCVDNTPRVP
jgi:hypothetical protein